MAALLPALRALADATADNLRLPRPPRMRLVRRGGRIRLRACGVEATGHLAAPSSLVSALVVEVAGRAIRRPTVWSSGVNLWFRQASAFFDLARACLARGRVEDARDLAYLAIIENLYLEDVADGTKPPPPDELSALVAKMESPIADENAAHLSVIRRLVPRLAKADRRWQLPLLRALDYVVRDAAYANPLTLAELVTPPALAMVRHDDARGEAALTLVATLAGTLMLGRAYAEALPLLDVLVARGWELPRVQVERFVARAALADPHAEADRVELDALARAHRGKLRPHLAELEPWAALALAHVQAGEGLLVRSRGLDPCLQRPKGQIPKLAPGDDLRLRGLARAHVERARRLLGESLVADVDATTFDGVQRRKHIHEGFHALDGELHRAAGEHSAALAAFARAHDAAQRDAYDHKKKAHVAAVRALAKKVGVPAPV